MIYIYNIYNIESKRIVNITKKTITMIRDYLYKML